MTIVQTICSRTISGALVGAGLTTLAKLSVTVQEQRQGALIGATSACATSLLRPVIAEVGARIKADARKIALVDVATYGVVNAVALGAFHSAGLLNAPTTVLFGLFASIEPLLSLDF